MTVEQIQSLINAITIRYQKMYGKKAGKGAPVQRSLDQLAGMGLNIQDV